VLGVFHPDLVGIQARVLQRLGSRRVLVVHGLDGLDEIALSGLTMVAELKNNEIREYTVSPADFGLRAAESAAIRVANVDESKAMMLGALEGKEGPARDIVALNAGASVYVAGLAPTLAAGVELALQTMRSGAARRKVDEFVAATQAPAKA
jgi:anthranilate phosphoribosyltransferase